MDTREIIIEILEEMHSDVDFDTAEELVTGKILDSFDLVSLVSELSNEFDIQITAKEFIEENFNSVDALTAMVEMLMDE